MSFASQKGCWHPNWLPACAILIFQTGNNRTDRRFFQDSSQNPPKTTTGTFINHEIRTDLDPEREVKTMY